MLANNFLTSDFLYHSRYLLPRLELSKSFTSMFKCCAIQKAALLTVEIIILFHKTTALCLVAKIKISPP